MISSHQQTRAAQRRIQSSQESDVVKALSIYVALAVLIGNTASAIEPGLEILLWPNGAPGSEGKTNLETSVRITDAGDHVLSNIHKPSITPYLPSASMPGPASGRCAVIVAPGGGHRELWSDHEGHNVARWLSERGIAAFVLKYRLARETNSTYTVDDHAVADMQRALRLVRSRAAEWGIATNRIGVMGFSAGGEVAFLSAQRFDTLAPPNGERAGVRGYQLTYDTVAEQNADSHKPLNRPADTFSPSGGEKEKASHLATTLAPPNGERDRVRETSENSTAPLSGSLPARSSRSESDDPLDALPALPAFQALIYPGRSQRIEPATNSPPVFLVCGDNDRQDISEGLASVYLKFKQLKVPAELHIYAGSGHGFGFRPQSTINSPPSTGTSKWIERFEEWLADSRFLKKQ
jgi:acetyl esterase/lipase